MSYCILVIAHAPTGSALVSALRHILHDHLNIPVFTLDIDSRDQPEKKIHEAQQLLTQTEAKHVLICTDLMGSTPYHIAHKVMKSMHQKHCALITGISLALLIKASSRHHRPFIEWVTRLSHSAAEWVKVEENTTSLDNFHA